MAKKKKKDPEKSPIAEIFGEQGQGAEKPTSEVVDQLFSETEAAPPEPEPGAHRVLLVDDSPVTRAKLGAVLRQMGCRVIEAEDGRQALLKVRQVQPHLIVLDIMMPNKGGMETLSILRRDARFRDTPIVMLTVKKDAETVREALKLGANDYILKDGGLRELRERLQKFLPA